MSRRSRRRRKQPTKHRVNGTVYLLEIELEGKVVYKVGVTANALVKTRVLQLIDGMEKVYGYYPKVTVRAEEKCSNYYQVESMVHRELEDYSYEACEVFGGCTELFIGEYAIISDKYKECIANSDEFSGTDNILEW